MVTFDELWHNSIPSVTIEGPYQTFDEYFSKNRKLIPNAYNWFNFEYAFNFVVEVDSSPEYLLTPQGAEILKDRFLLKDSQGNIVESPKQMIARVALALADAEDEAIEFFKAIYDRKFMPSSPILFNAGLSTPQLSSCYIHTVPDSIDGIFKSYSDMANMAKFAGGIGTDWTFVRGISSLIKGTGRTGAGLIPWLKIQDSISLAVNQGGRRKGAHCVYLEVWHKEIFEFVKLKKQIGDENRLCHHLHTAVWVPDKFMEAVETDGYWYLFCPSYAGHLHTLHGVEFDSSYSQLVEEGKYEEQIKARDLWRHILTNLFETGHPWITWKDRCNENSKFTEPILSSNLCTEITLPTSFDNTAVCTLSSINLAAHKSLQEIQETTKTVVKFLNKIIDKSWYPTKEAEYHAKKYRPLGLGVMGYQDALQQRGIVWGSEEHKEYDEMVFSVLSAAAKAHSQNNYTLTAIAPTATISHIVGVSPSIEPYFSNIYSAEGLSGTFTIANPQWLKYIGECEKPEVAIEQELKGIVQRSKLFDTAFELDQNLITEAASRRQKYICQSQSVNYYVDHKDGKKLSDMYMNAWKQGLKTTYYLRTKAASRAESQMDVSNYEVRCDGCE